MPLIKQLHTLIFSVTIIISAIAMDHSLFHEQQLEKTVRSIIDHTPDPNEALDKIAYWGMPAERIGPLVLKRACSHTNQKATSYKAPPLHVATGRGHIAAMDEFMLCGENVDARNNLGHTPLHLIFDTVRKSSDFCDDSITQNQRLNCARFLLYRGANPNIPLPSPISKTPLEYALIHCDHEVAHLLLLFNATFTTEMVVNAIEKDHSSLLEDFLDSGIDPNMRLTSGINLLHKAALHGSVESMRVLLTHGANIKAIDAYGQTAFHWATQYKQEAAALFLATHEIPPPVKH